MSYHCDADQCRCSIDIQSTKQSEQFNTLDEHGKAVLEALSNNRDIILEVVRSEATHTATSILAKQDEARFEIVTSIAEQGQAVAAAISEQHVSIQDAIQYESAKSDERHRNITVTVVAKHEETHAEVTKALELLGASSRTEHEATRRELEQTKKAMAQIEQDMIRRDEELKGLLMALGQAHTVKERRKLQEKSNAVTVALCALVTMYQSLQV
jgi:hypothetical protein